MAYTKQDWATGETITEEKLDHMEDGIKSANDYLFNNTAVTFTMQDHCTLTRGGAWRMGNTIFVNCVISVDAQLASNTNLVRISNWAIPSTTADLIARLGTSAYPVYVSSGGYIRCSGTWAAGDYAIIGAYPISD